MSEALSSTEIEDVLSSIRRLVSEDMRPVSRPAGGGPAVASNDKLILTPALRVVPDDAEKGGDAPVFVHHPRQDAASNGGGIEQVVASLGAAVGAQSTEWESEAGDISPEFAEGHGAGGWSLPTPDHLPDADLADDAVPPQNFVFASASESGGGTVEEVLPTSDAAPEQIPGWAQEDDGTAIEEDPVGSAPATGSIEPDPAWADAAEASVIAALADEPVAEDDLGDAQLPEDEALLFNEDVLRELVRDILREELAGRMGERITRNIRKLVRAEIARSLAAQGYE